MLAPALCPVCAVLGQLATLKSIFSAPLDDLPLFSDADGFCRAKSVAVRTIKHAAKVLGEPPRLAPALRHEEGKRSGEEAHSTWGAPALT